MKKSFIILSLIIFVSCAKWSDQIASKGSLSDPLWSQYHEYHIENESISYREKYAK